MQSYQIRHQIVTINNWQYPIRSLKDRLQYDDPQNRAAELGISSAAWPLFGVLWPCSSVLATTVSGLELANKRVLEIGCGIGLSSIVLHRMGVDITASDYHPLAREFLEKNIAGNKLSPIKFQTGNWETANPELGQFDLIIGSDVLYEPAHPARVSDFVYAHSQAGTDVIIVDPNRSNRARFTDHMIALGYTHHFARFDVPGTDDIRCKGRILHYRLEQLAEHPATSA